MTLLDYLRILRKRWSTVVALVVLGIAVAAGVTALIPKSYQAQSTSLVTVTSDGSDATGSSIYQGSQFTVQRVQSYTELATSPQVLTPVISLLHLNTTVADLRKKVSAQSPAATALLEVTASDGNASTAADIANAIAGQMRTQIEKLETPVGAGQSRVNVTAVKPAEAPLSPASPRLALDLALGLLVGAALGVIVAVVRDQLDTRISTAEELQAVTGAAPLGAVAFVRQADQRGPGALADRSAFSSIRTNLRLSDVDNPPRCVAVTSTLPDEGRTTTVANLATILAGSEASVCLVEADLHRPKVAAYLGITGAVGLSDVLSGVVDLDDALVERGRLTVLAAGAAVADPGGLLSSSAMESLVESVRGRYDFVLIDVPPLLSVADGAAVARMTDGAVLVVRHRHAPREQIRQAVQLLATANARLLGTVRTFVPAGKGPGYGARSRPALPVVAAGLNGPTPETAPLRRPASNPPPVNTPPANPPPANPPPANTPPANGPAPIEPATVHPMTEAPVTLTSHQPRYPAPAHPTANPMHSPAPAQPTAVNSTPPPAPAVPVVQPPVAEKPAAGEAKVEQHNPAG
ncbi:MAG TPA: polysaccharide biosynthesis tyrosine autokinase [Mycobacteriales bacterium]|nr:polysaccharide biosynthesis tyrosine autokinase [Mycobacteriales bacterium]